MIVDTHTHVVSSDKVKHPLDPGARGWSTEVTNDVEDLIKEMDKAGVEAATLVQPAGTYAHDNTYQCDSAAKFAPRTVAVGTMDPTEPGAADKLSWWYKEHGMRGVRLMGTAEPDDSRCDALWARADQLGIPLSLGGGGGAPEKIDRVRAMAARHPNVKIAPDHFAGLTTAKDKPAMTKALVDLAKQPNAYLRITTTTLLTYDALTQEDKDAVKRVIDAFTPQRVMWGSNFPGSREGGYSGLVKLGQTAIPWLSAADRRWILGDSALKLWPGLKAAAKK